MDQILQLEDLIRQGHYAQTRIRAWEMLSTTDDLRVKQLYAFSLSKSGVPEAAREFLEGVARQYPEDPETNGILGGIYKELFRKNQSATFATMARDVYEKNFRLTKNYYTGINAATMSTLAGQGSKGKKIAQEVLEVLSDTENDFWQAATEGEAYLLLKERARSEKSYLHARHLAASDWGKIRSVHNQLWLLKHYMPVPPEAYRAYSPPVVVAFVGHMIDHPDRLYPRFPASIEQNVKQALSQHISNINGKIGYCSLACGGDILFAEAMEEAGGELNLFLPFRKEDFIEASVSFAGNGWTDRFNRLVTKHPVTYLTEESYEDHADLFALQTSIIFGLSQLRSAANHQEPMLITVLSEHDHQKKLGGTRDTLGMWPNPKNHLSINPDAYVPVQPQAETPSQPDVRVNRTARPVLYFVCCDLSTGEKLNTALLATMEESLPPLVYHVYEGRLIAGYKTLLSAMEFADAVTKTLMRPFQQKNVLRISLHVGPFQLRGDDDRWSGNLIAKLLQIHELTAQGSIYASGIFAAVLALDASTYSFDYIDSLPSNSEARALDVYKVNVHKRGAPA